jgi:hypothetical protein
MQPDDLVEDPRPGDPWNVICALLADPPGATAFHEAAASDRRRSLCRRASRIASCVASKESWRPGMRAAQEGLQRARAAAGVQRAGRGRGRLLRLPGAPGGWSEAGRRPGEDRPSSSAYTNLIQSSDLSGRKP